MNPAKAAVVKWTAKAAAAPMTLAAALRLKTLHKRIRADPELALALALALWNTGNYDARSLAVKIANPARMSAANLDRWVRDDSAARMFCSDIGMLAAEETRPAEKAAQWLDAPAAKRIGPVDVDHGDTACKTPDAASYIAKTWNHSTAKGFASPAAHERTREPSRLRC